MARKLAVEVPQSVSDEISRVAKRSERSIAFVVQRALAMAKPGSAAPPSGPQVALEITSDEDDGNDALAKIARQLGDHPGQILSGAWAAAREKFLAWLAKVEAVDAAHDSSDLDRELAEAENAATPAARLRELARSQYPRVRALAAAHANTPSDTLGALAKDRDRTVREAAKR